MSAWEKNIRKVIPYVPGEQPKDKNIIKLNTNENPYDPSPRVMAKQLELEALRKYPDPSVSDLVNALADYHGVSNSQVFVGVGSDDVIAMSFMTFFHGDKPILFPDITYSFYDVWAELFGISYNQVAVDDNFELKLEDYYQPNGGIIFPNPNAPTSIAKPISFIEDVVKHNTDVVVIVDEAYVDFGCESALSLVDKYDNVLVVRTYSKSRSMAGLRIGYAIGNEKLIRYLNDVKYSFNSYTMNYPSIVLGVESLADEDYFRETIAKVMETRDWFTEEIRKIGFSCPDSSTNFVFVTHDKLQAKDIYEQAKANKIIVRYFAKPRIDNYLRITIGTREEMETFLTFLKKLVSNA